MENGLSRIAHYNLRNKYLPHKKLIADVIMDKNPAVRTVINKTEMLGEENEFRILDYELLAGDPDLNVDFHVDGLRFRFNYSKVFWNSRLDTEHKRLVDKFSPGEVVCDVMAGVGPFAIRAGKKGVFVMANDLNPDCFISLKDAIKLNKVDPFVEAFNNDGHQFIHSSAQDLLQHQRLARVPVKVSRTEAIAKSIPRSYLFQEIEAPRTVSHFVMNLPGSALEFLMNFRGLYANHKDLFEPHTRRQLPMIHCYCFGPKANSALNRDPVSQTMCDRISASLGDKFSLGGPDTELWCVRDVAPNKSQYCASFRLSPEVAFS